MNTLQLWKYRFLKIWHSAKALNRRVEVEQYLLDCANGKRSLPDNKKCRELALRLGQDGK